MKKLVFKIIRLLLGLFMVVIGLNKFLVFIEIPSPVGDGGVLMQIYINSGFLYLIGILQLSSGVALLMNKFVPLGLTLITAIMFNATIFHALHEPQSIGPAIFCLLLSSILIYTNKERFSEVMRA